MCEDKERKGFWSRVASFLFSAPSANASSPRPPYNIEPEDFPMYLPPLFDRELQYKLDRNRLEFEIKALDIVNEHMQNKSEETQNA